MALKILRVLLALFLIICVGVHIYGLIYHAFSEPTWSHIVHIISYSICLFTFLRPVKFGTIFYFIGAIYPFFFHANCFFRPLFEQHRFNTICLEVIIVLPLAGWLLLKQKAS